MESIMVHKNILKIVFLLSFYGPLSHAENQFGYISYWSHNLGDHMQSIAAKRFLPENSIGIVREGVQEFRNVTPVNTIVNGWFARYENNKVSWPPSPSINPLFISIHFTRSQLPEIFTEENITYLKKHGPVGARDTYTLNELHKRKIPCYYSGCLTLTLDNDQTTRDPIVYVVELDQQCLNYVKSKTSHKVVALSHFLREPNGNLKSVDLTEGLLLAQNLLNKYKRATCVITSRLHAAMPCLALGTPVLLVNTQYDQYRFEGLKDLVRNCSQEELLSGKVDFNFNNPTPNSDTYLVLRQNLINTVKAWVKKHSS